MGVEGRLLKGANTSLRKVDCKKLNKNSRSSKVPSGIRALDPKSINGGGLLKNANGKGAVEQGTLLEVDS